MFDLISFIDFIHKSILGNEVNSLFEIKTVFCSKEEGKNVNIEFWMLEGKIGIRLVIKTHNAVKNEINKNLNFLIGISRINVINTANNAFLEVVKSII